MFRKKLLVAGVAAAMTVATGMTAYATPGMGDNNNTVDFVRTANVQSDDQQATKDDSLEIDKDFSQDTEKPDQNNGQAPSGDNTQKPDQNNGQAPSGDNTQKPDQNNGQAPSGDNAQTPGEAMEQPGRKSDEEAMKEGNPTPDLPEGVTAEKPDDLPDRTAQKPADNNGQAPSGDNAQAPDQNMGQAPSGDNTQAPDQNMGQAPSGDNTQAPDQNMGQAPSGDNTQTPGAAMEQPGKKSDEDAMKEGNAKPELPTGVITEGEGSNL